MLQGAAVLQSTTLAFIRIVVTACKSPWMGLLPVDIPSWKGAGRINTPLDSGCSLLRLPASCMQFCPMVLYSPEVLAFINRERATGGIFHRCSYRDVTTHAGVTMQRHGSSFLYSPSPCSVKESPKSIGSPSWTLMGPSFGLSLVSYEERGGLCLHLPKETVPKAQSLLSQAGWGNLLRT